MCTISVLMSIYNESEKELNESIASVLNQTYRDFEFIIVNDNPQNEELKTILKKWINIDERIKIIENKRNIGLALSLNKAAEIAKGKYLARMDADDISLKDRFEKQVVYLEKNSYMDLVCSNFYFINDRSQIIDRKFDYFSTKQLKRLLTVWNTVHHPTVMMKKTSFLEVGGYRDFPCAQDYDLWLRMLNNNCNFYMLHEKLLKYRIRENSTTSSKRLLQVLTMNYIKQLNKERLKKGFDSYSEANYRNYLISKKYFDDNYTKDLINKRKIFRNIQANIRERNYFKAILRLLYLIYVSDYFRNRFFTVLEFKILNKF